MKRNETGAVSKEDNELDEALAVLISNTRNRKRPLPLTEIARWLQIAVGTLGSYSAVADRIGLSGKMLRQFSYVRKLSRPVQDLFSSKRLDSVDAAAHLAMLPADDQVPVAEALAAGEIDTGDVRAIIDLRRAGRSESSKAILERVKSSKTITEYIAEFIVRGAPSPDRLRSSFTRYIPPSEIVRVEIEGPTGRLVLTGKGKMALAKAARTLGATLKGVIPLILRENEQG